MTEVYSYLFALLKLLGAREACKCTEKEDRVSGIPSDYHLFVGPHCMGLPHLHTLGPVVFRGALGRQLGRHIFQSQTGRVWHFFPFPVPQFHRCRHMPWRVVLWPHRTVWCARDELLPVSSSGRVIGGHPIEY